jgi:AcrR family transcriptional regulator
MFHMATQTQPTRQRRKQDRPQELLDAALMLFVEKGFAATRTEEVALRAGVSKGTLYLYYASKEELLKAVIRENMSQLISEGQELALEFQGSMAELLSHLMHTWWERVGSTPASGIHKIMLTEVRNFPDIAQFYQDEVIGPAHQLIGGVLSRGIQRGEFRAVPVTEVTQMLIAPLIFMALHQHSFGACQLKNIKHPAPADLINAQMDLVLGGLLIQTKVKMP